MGFIWVGSGREERLELVVEVEVDWWEEVERDMEGEAEAEEEKGVEGKEVDGGAESIPRLNKHPAALPYPIWADIIWAVSRSQKRVGEETREEGKRTI